MDTKMIMIIVAVVLVLISSSIGSYFMMSGGSEDSSSSTSPASTPPASTPPPPATPTVNWAGNAFTSDGRCGPQFGNKACNGTQCCSQFGWCGGQKGQNDDWCGKFKAFEGKFDGEKP